MTARTGEAAGGRGPVGAGAPAHPRLELVLHATAGRAARTRQGQEHTAVCGHASQTGGSGPAAGGWGAIGGRVGPPDQGPGGAPGRGVGQTSRQPGDGGTPGQTGAGGAPKEPVPGGPPATSGMGGTPGTTGGGGGGTATTGWDVGALPRAASEYADRAKPAVWVPLRGNEQLVAQALARRAVLLVDDHRALLAVQERAEP